ncbi:Indoleamine 2,3-dioxygenase subfamily [Talaromyces stipitatus ATCC 10500]|uniref:Indoleamine 2,3-dioxygenase n=1 Tax=Talaromyces stipitatus (strain ATCC 10500 / CBS 375.48 / QM 6759 / NRRL 1006) TaxID=441959 RepID=B8M563_TALSN|nr:Indoleamine 2,3-dioxygenase subfamily [Talaromyces stipitatus ATCC 10500]EED19669.1 Indoleamine 2,3-dioxygenase subfamily [Talaromyces stipitatus ATCC 10500]
MLAPIPVLSDYDIDPQRGFLPPELPLTSLPDPYYAKWETVIDKVQALILSGRIRSTVQRLPVLSTAYLHTEAEWQRAYVVLTFMLHAYVWGGDVPEEIIPPPISVPLLEVCEHLDLPPVATYAAVCLWNYKPIFPDEPADDLENLSVINTLTGSTDEQWFYLVSVAIEARGAPMLPLMLEAIAAARREDSAVVTSCLQELAQCITEISVIMQRLFEHCDPHVFYHKVRPFLAGSKNMGDAGLPRGVMFDTDTGTTEYRQYGGGSNAQSSLVQFFDIVLGIEHRPTGIGRDGGGAQSDSEGLSPKPRHNFIQEMRQYMPPAHRKFLEHIGSVANIREYVDAHRSDKALCLAYDASLAMLRDLRDKHIQVVSRYIIVKSREQRRNSLSNPRPPTQLAPPPPPTTTRINLANVKSGNNKKLRGTGGTALIPFLKQARDETGEPAIDAWARRLLSNGPADRSFATLGKVGEHADGQIEIVGMAGTWAMDESEGGICHW